jgi:hypothetical protein
MTMVIHRVLIASAVAVGIAGCRKSDPPKSKGTGDVTVSTEQANQLHEAKWMAPMSNELLQDWIAFCGPPAAKPTADQSAISIWLGDAPRGRKCMLVYVQATMTLQDIQISVQAKDADAAQAAFVDFTGHTVMPLLPPPVRAVVTKDITDQQEYKTKKLGSFTAAMHTEVMPDGVLRWMWIHYDAPKSKPEAR